MKQIISPKKIIRFLVLLIIILTFAAGYYKSVLDLEIKKYNKLEDRYVRVREALGVEKTQELIDISKENDNF